MDLHDIFQNITTKDNKPLSKLSVSSYISKLNRISMLCTKKPFTSDTFLRYPTEVIKCIKDSNLKNPKDYLAAIVKYIRHADFNKSIIDAYAKEMNDSKKIELKERGDNKAKQSDISRVGGLTLKEIQKKINDFDVMDDKDRLMNKLILAMYFNNFKGKFPLLVPRNDLPVMKIVSVSRAKKSLPDTNNYLVVNDTYPLKIVMKNYKTAKTYGTQSYQICDELTRLLEMYIKVFNKKSSDFLFTNKDDKEFKNSTFLSRIKAASKQILNTDFGVDLIRQLIITNTYGNNPLMTINEKNELARAFLHSPSVGAEYVRPELAGQN
jgi:hypothetical protein